MKIGQEDADDHSFVFKADYVQNTDTVVTDICNSISVDCGATAHIITSKESFLSMKDLSTEKHIIELADGSRLDNVVLGKGNASISVHDSSGVKHDIVLENVLYIPSYKQNTWLYYLNSVKGSKKVSHSSKDWHQTMGHCNVQDILALEKVVDGMEVSDKLDFNCDTCTLGKMPQYRNGNPDRKASKLFELVHCDPAGPIEPVAREGFKYCLMFVDDYSGVFPESQI